MFRAARGGWSAGARGLRRAAGLREKHKSGARLVGCASGLWAETTKDKGAGSLEKEPVLVLVTLQHACARLIREGVDLALREGRPVKVLHVVNPDAAPIGEPAINAQALDYLYALSGEAGAEMCVLTSKAPVTAIANYANECGARHVVMGGGERARGIAETLSQLLPGVRVLIMERE